MPGEVRFRNDVIDRRPLIEEAGHERRDRQRSGVLACELLTLTPLCIHSVYRNLKDGDSPYVPASSLRGMIRNMVEMLGAGCVRLMDRAPRNTPQRLEKCSERSACRACRMFGFTDGDFSWASKVTFGDAHPLRAPGTAPSAKWIFCDLRRAMTGFPAEADGWRIFSGDAGKLEVSQREQRNWNRCVAADSKFRFRVDYSNLDAEALALLLYAISLKYGQGPQLCHKIGYAKALGAGTVTITFQKVGSASPPEPGAEVERYLAGPAYEDLLRYRSLP